MGTPPHTQVYYTPSDGAVLYSGDYVAPFALDGYYPLYKTIADAKKVSSDDSVQSHGPASDTGHPLFWSTGEFRLFYMPSNGPTKFYGTYGAAESELYSTALHASSASGGDGSVLAAAAAQAVAAQGTDTYFTSVAASAP